MKPEVRVELLDFLRAMTPAARALVERFPPGCTVRGEGYAIPSAFVDHVGRVVSYGEPGESSPEGYLGVVDDWPLNFGIRGHVEPSRMTLVAVSDLCTTENVRELIREIET